MRGLTIGIFLMALVVFTGFMSASGVNQALGVSMHNNLADDAQSVNDTVSGDKNLGNSPGDSMLGPVGFVMDQVSTFFTLFGGLAVLLISWGAPPSLAWGLQMLVMTIGGLMLLWIALRVVME